MRKLTLLLLVLSFSVLTSAAGDEKYGKELTMKEKTNVSAILESPETYVGKKVLVEGEIVAVCQHRGCWIDIKSDKADQKIRVKVEDGVIVFPEDAKGKTAVVEGEIYKLEVKKEESAEEHAEHAEKEKIAADDKAKSTEDEADHVCTEVSTVSHYQIKGIGAVIK